MEEVEPGENISLPVSPSLVCLFCQLILKIARTQTFGSLGESPVPGHC